MPNFVYHGRNKEAFLRDNRDAFLETIETVNSLLAERYGSDVRPVTLADLWVITYCEAGIDGNGMIDVHFRHSNKEIGVYPLPSNIEDWNGPNAPAYNKPHPVDRNARHYLEYLGHLKNRVVKTLDGTPLYRDLFTTGNSEAKQQKNARLLAGVVHGYFFEGTYEDREVPLVYLRAGYDAGEALDALLAPTRYKHAGKSLMANRADNIEAALRDMAGG